MSQSIRVAAMKFPQNPVLGDASMSRGECAPNGSPAQGSARVKRPPQMGTAPALVRELREADPLIWRQKLPDDGRRAAAVRTVPSTASSNIHFNGAGRPRV